MSPDARNFLFTGAIIAVVVVGLAVYLSLKERERVSSEATLTQGQPLHDSAGRSGNTPDSALYDAIGLDLIGPDTPPDFSLPDVNGGTRSLKDFKGKVLLVNFWATWCEPCRAEIPALERLYQKHKNSGFDIVAINDYESPDKARNFHKKHKMSFTVLIDESGKTSEAYMAHVLPTSFVLDSKGRVIGRFIGARHWDAPEFDTYFKSLLKDAAPSGAKSGATAKRGKEGGK